MIDFLAKVTFNGPLPRTSDNLLSNILYIAFGALGGISVIIIIWAGIKYTMSGGDPNKTAEAKNQILYAAVGLAVALSATAIVTFAGSRL